MVSISELRCIAQGDLVEPPIYRPFRRISIYVTAFLIRTSITPDLVTLGWVALLGAGSYFFSLNSQAAQIGAVFCILGYYILDCVDGELARARNSGSKLGSQLEQIGHWLTNGVLLVGIAYGQLGDQAPADVILWLSAALVGDYTFHFTYYQLNLLFNRDVNYGALHLITRLLYLCMPINTNLLLLGALGNSQWVALCVWAVVSNIGWMVAFSLYYAVERRLRGATKQSA